MMAATANTYTYISTGIDCAPGVPVSPPEPPGLPITEGGAGTSSANKNPPKNR